MKKFTLKKVLGLMLCLVLVVGVLAACGGGSSESNTKEDVKEDVKVSKPEESQPEVDIKLAHVGSEQHQYQIASLKFKELIEEKSGSSISVQIFHGGQLGGEGDNVEGIQSGTIDMTVVAADSSPANIVPELNVFGIPYLFRDREHVYKVVDGEIGQELLELGEPHGLIGLGYWEIGFANFTNSKRPINTPEDMAGLKLRVQPAPIWNEFMKRLNALPTPMSFTELYSAMEQGVVDGQENPIATINAMKFYEVQPNIALTRHTYKAATVFVSEKVWNSLSDDQKEWMKEAVSETYKYQREYLDQKESETIEALKATNTITEPDIDAFVEVTKGIEEAVSDKVPQELVDRIRAQ